MSALSSSRVTAAAPTCLTAKDRADLRACPRVIISRGLPGLQCSGFSIDICCLASAWDGTGVPSLSELNVVSATAAGAAAAAPGFCPGVEGAAGAAPGAALIGALALAGG